MVIKRKDGTTLADVWLQDSSFVYEEIMGDHSAQIDFLSRYPIELEIGDYIEHEGYIYTLRHKESVTKRETSLGWDYSVVMYSARYELQDVPFFLTDQPEYLKNGDYYTGTASDWLTLIVKNMNREISGWSVGACIESEWITISFKDKQCSEVLDELCAQLDTEWQVIGRTLSIGRVEYPSDGLVLSQGEGGGLKELRLSSSNQERPVTVLYPYGQDKNLPEGYGADYLLLPGRKKVLERNTEKYGRCGMKVQFDVYPKGEFEVTSIIDELTFTATGIDFDIAACLIPDTEVTISFQSGALAGYDLAIAEDGWDNSTKTIKVLQNEEENALKVPGDLRISAGDRFALFNLRMPKSYVDKAEKELEQKAQAWINKKSEKEVSLSAKCDDILFKQNSVSIRCGQMVRILSLELDLDKEIRVTKVKRHIENDCPAYRYELTLSDFLDTNGFKQLVKEVENVPEEIKTQTNIVRSFTRRSWRDAKETLDMLEKAMLDNFTGRISPIAVETMAMLVGDESLQFRFVSSKTNPVQVAHSVVWDNDTKQLSAESGILQHMTLGISSLSSSHGVSEYKYWDIPSYISARLEEADKSYYLYAKVSKTAQTGVFLLSETAIKMEEVAGYYHLLVGILNSEYDGERSFVTLYGFTEILPGRITTDRVVSADGQSYFDFVSDSFKLGQKLIYNNGILKIDGAIEWGSLSKDMQDKMDGYATTQSVGEALQSYATNDSLANAVSDKVSTSTLTEKLSSYALKTALNDYATKTALGGKEDSGTANSLLDAFWTALKDGDTTIYNGVINTEFIDVDTISANLVSSKMVITDGAKIGGFNVGSSYLNSDSGCYIRVYEGTVGAYIGAQKMSLAGASRNISVSGTGSFFGSAFVNNLYVLEGINWTLKVKAGFYIQDYEWPFVYFKDTNSTTQFLIVGRTNNLGICTTNTDGLVAHIDTAGEYHQDSDIRIKNKIEDVRNVLPLLEELNVFKFTFTDNDKVCIGVSAQDVQRIFPELVDCVEAKGYKDLLTLNYSSLSTIFAVQGLKELHAKVKSLEERIKALESLLNKEEQS